jgi:hypothetical protein
MIRALAALLGFAAAAALLELAPRAGDLAGTHLWYVAGVWALAGVVAGALYQAGGVRRPGLRMNSWMLILVFAPWMVLSLAVVTQVSNPGSMVARWARDAAPDVWLSHWMSALAVFPFVAGLLLALSFVEPLVGVRPVIRDEVAPAPAMRDDRPVRASDDTLVDHRALRPEDAPDTVRERTGSTAQAEAVDARERATAEGRPPADGEQPTRRRFVDAPPIGAEDGDVTVVRADGSEDVVRTTREA